MRRGLSRRKAAAIGYIGVDEKSFRKGHKHLTLSPEQSAGISGVAMDMWEPYVQSIEGHLADAKDKIVFDKFHVSKHLNAKIQWVKYTARGFRNVDNFKNAIYFHCGDLNLAHRPT